MPPVVRLLLADVPLQVYVGIILHDTCRKPPLHRRASPTAIDDTDRYVKYPVHHHCKVECRSTEKRRILRVAHLPFARTGLYRFQLSVLFNGCHPYALPLCRSGNSLVRTFYRAVPEAVQRHLHIRLPRTEPHLTYQHIVQLRFFAIRKSNGLRLIRSGRRLHLGKPFAGCIALYLIYPVTPRYPHAYLRIRIRLSP